MTMNVVIVGNSNCVFKEGFSRGVERAALLMGGVVKNYSLGGSCCALHLYTLHDKYEELKSADLVILDSLVIDTFHWRRKIIKCDELFRLIDDMYALYSALPARVISVLFPIKKYVGSHESLPTYRAHMAAAKKYGIDVVDLYRPINECGVVADDCFMQPSHLKTELAHEIGVRVVNACENRAGENIEQATCVSPYEVYKGELFSDLRSITVESSLLNAECYLLDKEVSLGSLEGKHLVGAMHWNKSDRSRVAVSASDALDVVPFRSKYAFFEVLNESRKLSRNSAVRPAGVGEEPTQQPAGKNRESGYGLPQLIGLLARADGDVKAKSVDKHHDLSSVVGDVFG